MMVPAAGAAALPAGHWSDAYIIESPGSGGGSTPKVVANDAGDVFAVWVQSGASDTDIWAAHRSPSGAWGAPQRIDNSVQGDAYDPRIGVDAQGNAVAAWLQFDGAFYDVRANRYTAGWGWEDDVQLSASGGSFENVAEVTAAMGTDGEMFVAWSQGVGSRTHVFVSTSLPQAPWSAPHRAQSNDSNDESSPAVGTNGIGGAALAFVIHDPLSSSWDVAVARFAFGTGWFALDVVDARDPYAGWTAVGVDRDTNVLVTWWQNDGIANSIWYNRYAAASGWSTAYELDASSSDCEVPAMAMSPSGFAAVIWVQLDSPVNLQVVRMNATGGWSLQETVAYPLTSPPPPSVAADAAGNVVVGWRDTGANNQDTMAGYYEAGVGWGPVVAVDRVRDNSTNNGEVAIAGGGEGIVVWQEDVGGEALVLARSFLLSDLTAPALSISAPSSGANVTASSVRVSGTTEQGTTVTVDGTAVTVQSDGTFSKVVDLGVGANTIVVAAKDAAGNEAVRTILLNFTDPTPALAAQLAEAKADAAAASASSNATAAQLAATQAALALMEANLSSAQASLLTTQQSLASAQGELAQTRTQMNATGAPGASGAAGGSDSTAMLIAVVAVGLGAVAIGLGMMARRPPRDGGRIAVSQDGPLARVEPLKGPGDPPGFQGGRIP